MAKTVTTYEQGLALELKLTALFKKMGYQVIHNAKKIGLSGAEHQIDVLVEYTCPLHTSKVVVEAKSYDKPIDKDRIMKLMQIVADVGADRGIIVTTSYFTPAAIKTATGHCIELWDREILAKWLGEIEISASEKGLSQQIDVKERTVKPILSVQEAEVIEKSSIERRAKGGLFRTAKIVEKLDSISLQYLPYYEADIQTTILEEEKTGLLSKRTVQKTINCKINLDAQNGDIALISPEGITSSYLFLKQLEDDEIQVFKSMQESGWYSAKSISGLGISEGKARKILSRLVTVGAVKIGTGNRGVTIYQPLMVFPIDPRILKPISQVSTMVEISKSEGTFASPTIEASDIVKRIGTYWKAAVSNISVIYYPFYVCSLTAQDGSQRTDLIDAVGGKLKEL